MENESEYAILKKLNAENTGITRNRIILIICLLALGFVFLPWTQNIRGDGTITTLSPDQRPQTIHSIIGGRIEKWYVREGDKVKKGDTILFISEIKPEYFDPNLIGRTQSQLTAKEQSVNSYMQKIRALDNQVDAMNNTAILKSQQALNKLKQARLKLNSDSMSLQMAKTNYQISNQQYTRYEQLAKEGLKSTTDLENRKLTLQKAQNQLTYAENELLSSRNELINSQVELRSIQVQFNDKISKTESEKYAAFSDMYDAEGEVTKLQNVFSNYTVRQGMYYITAPIDGFVTQALQVGIGETIKEGEEIVSIMPAEYQLSVAFYVRPMDLPLLKKGEKVRLQFDGWPAIVFSGWPNTSYGTYGGVIFAIDNFTSDNGMYRVLVEPDIEDHAWPIALRVGSGAKTITLLNNVPIWYEMWRNINGFPPDFYSKNSTNKSNEIKK